MHVGHDTWIALLNAEAGWLTDADMLQVIPADVRGFDGAEDWPRGKTLAYLANNVANLRDHFERLESGRPLDLDLLNPVLESCTPRLIDAGRPERREALVRRAREGRETDLFVPGLQSEGFNPATAHVRWVVQRAFWHFARYAADRWADPRYPAATPGLFRVLPAPGDDRLLVACPNGIPPLA